MLFLKRHFGHFIVSQLQSKHIANYRDKRLAEGKQGSTVVKETGSMNHLLDITIKDWWGIPLTNNVASLVRKPKQGKGRDRRLVDDEEMILIRAEKSSKSPLLPST